MFRLFILVVPFMLSACAGISGPNAGDDPVIRIENLYGSWVHSHEEDRDGVQIYRPAGSREFPAARFRMAYIFREDGTCEWMYLAPNDAHHLREGSWRFDDDDPAVIHVTQDDRVLTYRILTLTSDILRMRELTDRQ